MVDASIDAAVGGADAAPPLDGSALPADLAPPPDLAPYTGPIAIEVGAEEVVFDYVRDRCAVLDLPDVPAHAVRTADGIVLSSGNAPDNYFLFGPGFGRLARRCTPVLRSGDRPDFASFDHQEWVSSIHSVDGGKTIHALIHDEYHDPVAANCRPGVTDPSNPCWYNFLSSAVSIDGGRTFTQARSPDHLVAIPPFAWNAQVVPRGAPPPQGYFGPSNIVEKDGFYYSMFFAITSPTDAAQRGTCLMRTDDLSRPGSWRIWNGTGFDIPLAVPWPTPPANPRSLLCAFVGRGTIGDLSGSLTWNRALRQFVLVGAGVYPVDGTPTCGFFLSRSSDLLAWSPPQLIRRTLLGFGPCDPPTPDQLARHITQEAYPSLIDHDAPDVSFSEADETAWIYFMQNMDNHAPGGWGFRRNLVRVPITIKHR